MLNIIKKNKYLIILVLFTLPLFWRMLKFGMYSTQDFHLFRLHEFNECVQRFEIPCRWSFNAGLGYGEPLFNFYGQLGYVVGEIYYLISGSFINSIKFTFIFSLIASGISMYYLSKKIWNNSLGAFFSSILYLYAPYRAVDVWVRGALPESLSFAIFPLIFLSIEKKSLFWFSITTSILILTHNLSFVMFAPLVIIWLIYRKFWRGFYGFILSGMVSAFYILPVVFESKYININSTVEGYFNFHNHFVELRQLLLSDYWGYGASVWGDGDGLSLAIGYVQWVLQLFILLIIIFKKKIINYKLFIINLLIGWVFLFLTHNKSTVIWEILPFMKYIQFPWRFLGVALFCFSLASGMLFDVIKNKYMLIIALLLMAYGLWHTAGYFRPDIWYPVDDSYYLTGSEWVRQTTASIGDFWPNFGHVIPDKYNDNEMMNYFPGWTFQPDERGLIPTTGPQFKNTPIRTIGNLISLVSIIGLIWIKKRL